MKTVSLAVTALAVGLLPLLGNDQLVVHEWGTFTSFQDEQGRAIGGINTDDEPVPSFVHRIAPMLLVPATQTPAFFFQGAPRIHPHVTMRLETPVLYVHPPAGMKTPRLDVAVEFRGGWLTEYYPAAEWKAPGVDAQGFGPITAQTTGSLTWKDLEIGGSWPGPHTVDPVWLAPRAVAAASLRNREGEAEKYLFYRGVGNLEAPLSVTRTDDELRVTASEGAAHNGAWPPVWLVEVLENGHCAFEFVPSGSRIEEAVVLPGSFAEGAHSKQNLTGLRRSMKEHLVKEGLFDDEAEAMLNTWQVSYFQSAGTRLFFLAPRSWTDQHLPLRLSEPAQIVRVMMGRIELVTPRQRQLLATLAATEPADVTLMRSFMTPEFFASQENVRIWTEVFEGKSPLERLVPMGLEIPPAYKAYLQLGRFRNALILDQQTRHPSANLEAFIQDHLLQPYEVRKQ